MIMPSTKATIEDYLKKAIERLELRDISEEDLEKVHENIEKANEEIEKELEE
jgi:uncharacterized protein (DUF2236 family)